MPAVEVEAALDQLRALLGTADAPAWPPKRFGSAVSPATNWVGAVSDAAHEASNALNSRRQTLADAYAAVGPLVEQANHIATNARTRLDTIIAAWRTDKAALAAIANTAAGKAMLLHLGAARLAEARGVITDAQGQFSALAGKVNEVTARLPMAGPATGNGTVQAVDFNEIPQRPPGPIPETPWEYNLDFTSDVEAGSFDHPGVTSAGQVTSIEDAWAELNRCFNCNFPMGGAPSKLPRIGDELPLEIRIAGQQLPMHFPVKVTQIERTANDINIEFATLPGHVDGTGSTIHFRFYEQGGQLHLGIRGFISDGPGSEDIPIISPLARTGYTQFAQGVWQPYIDRLTRHVAEAKGFNVYGGR